MPACHYTFQIQRTLIGSSFVEVELYKPVETGNHPLIVVLHGSQGVFSRHSASLPAEDNLGEKTLAEHCFTVALPHYFDVVGLKSTSDRKLLESKFSTFAHALEQVIEQEADLPDTRNSSIGLYAESYGAYLAVSLIAANQRIHALSEFGGGWPYNYEIQKLKGVAVLMYHGEEDSVVPLSAGIDLARKMRMRGADVYMRSCPGQGHNLVTLTRREQLLESIALYSDHLITPSADSKRSWHSPIAVADCPYMTSVNSPD